MFALNPLPSSIEAYLQEAGFSLTEMLIIRRLFEQDGLTVRELAAKTGKSTGILDQAVKKLLRKNIITREWMNDTNRYALSSLDAIVKWMQEDMRLKKEMLQRKHQNFETFIRTLQLDRTRPEMEFYDGESGIEKAYRRLLGEGKEMLQFVPVLTTAEDDPLRAFRVEYFRERRRLGVFSRIIAHDTALGRRYRSRDPFEYRQTILVPKEEFPFTFEKIIAGDIVACFNFTEKRACLIRYPELASVERSLFEQVWRNALKNEKEKEALASDVPSVPVVSLTTRVLSAVREFFLSRKSLVIFGVFAVMSGSITFGLYKSNESLNFQRMQDKVVAIARTGAMQIDLHDLDQLHHEEDYKKPEWIKVDNQLKDIRIGNSDIMYVYIFRKSGTGTGLEFVADSHSQNPFANTDNDPTNDIDMNRDGKIDGSPTGGDYLSWPGQSYPTPPAAAFDSFKGLSASTFYEDQFGKVVTGYAPLKDGSGNTVAMFAVDMQSIKLAELTHQSFLWVYYFVGIFLLFVVIRLAAFNRSLVKEVYEILQIKKILWGFIICFVLALVATAALYWYTENLNLHRMQDKVESIAATGAFQFDPKDIDALQIKDDWHKPQWKKVVNQLIEIRTNNQDVMFVYILRKSASDRSKMVFVSDSHSMNPFAKIDLNGDGKIDEADALSPPDDPYKNCPPEAFDSYNGPRASRNFYTDQWGTLLSGYAPIKESGSTVAVLAVDMRASKLEEITAKNFKPLLYFVAFFVLFVVIYVAAFHRSFAREIWQTLRLRKVVIILALCIEISFFITLGLYYYTLKVMKEEVGTRLMSIAATAASEFDSKDLNQLHWAKDMKTEAYQRVFKKLNEIRSQNENIQWAYIERKTDKPEMVEFVADADSNYNLPFWNDLNHDGVPEPDEYNVAPGINMDLGNTYAATQEAFLHPAAESDFYLSQWGTYISGYAPIKDDHGKSVAIIGLDMDVSNVLKLTRQKFSLWLWFIGSFAGLMTFSLATKYLKK